MRRGWPAWRAVFVWAVSITAIAACAILPAGQSLAVAGPGSGQSDPGGGGVWRAEFRRHTSLLPGGRVLTFHFLTADSAVAAALAEAVADFQPAPV
ncbi:MAG TPA: hypothetical protein VM737_03265, partial [Gemmatimonadota bacterium]|nr:hypothetical protein [Gemmatimonadota bacterium]